MLTMAIVMNMTMARNDDKKVAMMCRIYDPELYRVVQTNVGHRDAVCNIIHVPERDQV